MIHPNPRSLLLLLLTLGLSSCDGTPPVEQVTSGLQGGVVDSSSSFAVGVCSGGVPHTLTWCASRCTGTLIAPNLVLTARHCVSKMANPSPYCPTAVFGELLRPDAWVTTKSEIAPTTEGGHVVRRIILPSDPHVCGGDIALLELEDVIPKSEAVTVEPVGRFAMTDHARYGTVHTMIGYGATSPTDILAGRRHRIDDVAIRCIPGDPAFSDCSLVAAAAGKEFGGGDGPCSGDSGSGSFEQAALRAGTPVTMGVLSRSREIGGRCKNSIYTRTDVHRGFIVAAVRAAATAGGYPAPEWATESDTPDAGSLDPTPKPDADLLEEGGGGGASASCTETSPCGEGCGVGRPQHSTPAHALWFAFAAWGLFARGRRGGQRARLQRQV